MPSSLVELVPLQTDAPARPPQARTSTPRVAILTLGCKLNQADSEAIARELAALGIDAIDRPAAADAYIINTCSVTHVADRKARHLVRLARRMAPEAPVIVTGCYVETGGTEVASITGADAAVGNADKPGLARRVAALCTPAATSAATDTRTVAPAGAGLRTRAFIKVQEGCNDVCAFCIVPKTRGREQSRAVAEVVRDVRAREREGVQEVVLTGTQLGAYGRDGTRRPADVIRAVLAGTAVPRIRFSSLQPQDIVPELLALWDDPRLCRHFHLALQSGSDATLGRMRRRYSAAGYTDAVARIRAECGDDVAITTDVIVGFPGETNAEFEESLAFCGETGFAAMHVFPYSLRTGTSAAHMPDHVPAPVKHERMQAMLAVARASQAAYLARFTGRVMPVLWERGSGDGDGARVWDGLTDTYMRVRARSSADLRNQLRPARLVRVADGVFEGEAL
jgi:threonylcarbamoyladenosine tRNA methylthiotransferase MtaB